MLRNWMLLTRRSSSSKVMIGQNLAVASSLRYLHSSMIQKKDFKLTDIGEGIVQVEVMKWFVKPGDRVKEFDPLVEVQSDKATVEITSRFSGVIKQLAVKEGDIAKVGEVLVVFEEADAAENGKPKQATEDQGADNVKAIKESQQKMLDAFPHKDADVNLDAQLNLDKVLATPAVRHLARQNNIDLKRIKGSGKDGRIMKDDVLSFIAAKTKTEEETQQHAQTTTTTSTYSNPERSVEGLSRQSSVSATTVAKGTVTTVPITGIRKEMVKTMTASLRVPHLGYMEDVIVDEALKLVDKKRNLTLLSILIKATSLALVEFPELNAHCNEDATELKVHSDHNVGIAMDTPRGLFVPVIHDVRAMSVLDISKELVRLKDLGQSGKLGLKELSGATITLSNIGSIGGTYASPVIVPPQVAIGAFGRAKRIPVFENNTSMNVKAVQIVPVSWCADHRVIDGATIARFCAAFKYYVENPGEMLLKLH